ncbi:MAG: hypothetical protein NVS4B8_25070 [Herpetosiphon sp.]
MPRHHAETRWFSSPADVVLATVLAGLRTLPSTIDVLSPASNTVTASIGKPWTDFSLQIHVQLGTEGGGVTVAISCWSDRPRDESPTTAVLVGTLLDELDEMIPRHLTERRALPS